jgi:LysR family transcriptional regulator, hypochlorite-specific transcription factor HypT
MKGARVSLLDYSAESGLGRLVRALRGQVLHGLGASARLEPVFTAHLATVLRTMALQGRGIAWLPRSPIDDDLKEHRLVEAAQASAQIALDIRLFRRAAPEPPAAEAFWEAVQAALH